MRVKFTIPIESYCMTLYQGLIKINAVFKETSHILAVDRRVKFWNNGGNIWVTITQGRWTRILRNYPNLVSHPKIPNN